jgi:hypothetical protein
MNQFSFMWLSRAFFGATLLIAFGSALAQQRYPVESRSEWHTGRYTQQHIIEAHDIAGHQIRIFELHRASNESSRMAFRGTKVKESRVWGYSDAFGGVGRNWGYGTWMLEDGNRINFEYSGTSQSQPTGNGGRIGTYDGVARITGGTGPFGGIRGMLVDVVEFNTDSSSGYNRATSKGEYWFVD